MSGLRLWGWVRVPSLTVEARGPVAGEARYAPAALVRPVVQPGGVAAPRLLARAPGIADGGVSGWVAIAGGGFVSPS